MQAELVTKIQNQAVNLRFRDLLLNALTVSRGVDAISFLALGKVFSAFMTGTSRFSAPSCRRQRPWRWPSLSQCHLRAGVYVSTRIVKPSEDLASVPTVTLALGISLIAHIVFLTVWFVITDSLRSNVAHVLLGSWGSRWGCRALAVRTLHVEGVFTTAATGPSYSLRATR